MPQARLLGGILLGLVSGVIVTAATLLLLPDGAKEWVADFLEMPVQVIVEKEVPVEKVVQVVVTATPSPTDSASIAADSDENQAAPASAGLRLRQ